MPYGSIFHRNSFCLCLKLRRMVRWERWATSVAWSGHGAWCGISGWFIAIEDCRQQRATWAIYHLRSFAKGLRPLTNILPASVASPLLLVNFTDQISPPISERTWVAHVNALDMGNAQMNFNFWPMSGKPQTTCFKIVQIIFGTGALLKMLGRPKVLAASCSAPFLCQDLLSM